MPALLSFCTLILFSRLVSPTEYGIYSQVLAAVGIAYAVCFQWLRLGISRFYAAYVHDTRTLLSTAAVTVGTVFGAIVILSLLAVPVLDGIVAHKYVMVALPLILLTTTFEFSLELLRASVQPRRYARLYATRSFLLVLLGTWFATRGYGQWGLLAALAVALAVPTAWSLRMLWSRVVVRAFSGRTARQLLTYGTPLTLGYALEVIIDSSDRLMLGALVGAGAAGAYAAGYGLAQQTMGVLLVIVHTAAFPLVVRAYEAAGAPGAQAQLAEVLEALLALGLPAVTAIAILAPNIATTVLGDAFSTDAVPILPWIAPAILLSGLRAYYVNVAFQLTLNTRQQVWISLIAAVTNISLNLALIPLMGLVGAAIATFTAYAVGLAASWYYAHRCLPLRLPSRALLRVIAATLSMGISLLPIAQLKGAVALIAQTTIGLGMYLIALYAVDGLSIRTRLAHRRAARQRP